MQVYLQLIFACSSKHILYNKGCVYTDVHFLAVLSNVPNFTVTKKKNMDAYMCIVTNSINDKTVYKYFSVSISNTIIKLKFGRGERYLR